MKSRTGRLLVALGIILIGVGLGAYLFVTLTGQPPSVDFTANHSEGQPVNITLQTVGAIGFGAQPQWVSYMTQDPNGQWQHTTLWDVPAHTRINVTIYQYDSGSPLRNQQWGQVQGTIGNTASVNGHTFRVFNSNNGNGVGHTFSIPTLGVNVPLLGVDGNAKDFCSTAAPCATSATHNTMHFSFMSPGPGNYPWQCFVPCGLGYLFGNGGPMQTVGYMGGFLQVQD